MFEAPHTSPQNRRGVSVSIGSERSPLVSGIEKCRGCNSSERPLNYTMLDGSMGCGMCACVIFKADTEFERSEIKAMLLARRD